MISVAIVTVVYNAEKDIEITMNSVLNQKYKNLEYVIMDGGSNDNTMPIISDYKSHFEKKNITLKVISEKDYGIYNAMNNSLRHIDSEYVLFLNAGDYFTNGDVISAIFKTPKILQYDIIYGDFFYYFKNYRKYAKSKHYTLLPNQMISTHQSFFIRTKLLQDRQYDEKYKMAADYDFLLDMYLKGKSFLYMDIPVVYFMANGISQRRSLITQKEVLDIRYQYIDISKFNRIMFLFNIPLICVKKGILSILPPKIRYMTYEKVKK